MNPKFKRTIQQVLSQYGIYFVFVLLVIVSSIISPRFLTTKNIISVSKQISVTGVLAFAMTLLIISGMIDLSMGSVLALAGMVGINAYLASGSYILAFVASCTVSVICAYINGTMITKLRLPAFIATMAMDTIARGSVYLYTDGSPIYQIGNLGLVSTTYVAGILPLPVVIMLGVGVITLIILRYTRFGRSLYASGGNAEAAEASGINVGRTRRMVFIVSGIFVGIAGILQMARLNSGLPDTAMNYHADAIASAVIGGTSFTGGIGTAAGTLVGAFIIGIISNILNLTGVQSYVQQIVKGCIIVFAVSFDLLGKARKVRKADTQMLTQEETKAEA
ncbi:MAG: ABC transporter permease [Acetivibrionales bacterium]|jgi:inositol transport system permease protein